MHTGEHTDLGIWCMTKAAFAAECWVLVASTEPQPDTLCKFLGPDADFAEKDGTIRS